MDRGLYAIILSFIAIFFGIVAIITSRPYLLDFNATGVMVTVLCCLVTVLIGWQIFNVLEISKIRKETLATRDEILLETNKNLLLTLHGLADFFSIQFINREVDASPNEENTLYFGALTYRAMEIKCASRLNELQVFQTAIRTMTVLIDNAILLSEHQVANIRNILVAVPISYRTDEFVVLLNHFQIE